MFSMPEPEHTCDDPLSCPACIAWRRKQQELRELLK